MTRDFVFLRPLGLRLLTSAGEIVSVFVFVAACGDPVYDLFSLPPARSAGRPAQSSEPISVATSDPATVSLQAEPPSASSPEFEASPAPA